jgi:uncharacterized protein
LYDYKQFYMPVKTVLISGGTGMVGRALSQHLEAKGYDVIILTRNAQRAAVSGKSARRVSFAEWDVEKQTIDASAISKADALIHLAGAGVVDKPWTDAYRKEIVGSRVNSSGLLVKAIEKHGVKLQTVVSASAIGWYGPDVPGQMEPFNEDSPAAPGFLGETCKAWEESIAPVTKLGKRLVYCRIGIVLSKEGGALPEFKKPLQFRVAGVLGTGEQIISWVHIEDLCRMFIYAIETPSMSGAYNAVAPNPVSNRELTITLGKCMHGNAFITMPVPAFVLKLMLGERSVEVLKSTKVSARKILDTGFTFNYPTIEKALAQLTTD